MLRYLSQYKDEFAEELNRPLMLKEADAPLVEYIKDAYRSLEIAPPIKIMGFEYSESESGVDVNRFIFKREKRKKKKDKFDYKFIDDSRCGSLTTRIRITLPVKNPKTNEIQIHQKDIKKSILIPLIDENGQMYINGKKFYLIYQLVEKSSYTSASSITVKSLMPITLKRDSVIDKGLSVHTEASLDAITSSEGEAMKRTPITVEATDATMYTLPVYTIFMFKKEIPAVLFYMANGIDWTLSFLGVSEIISFESELRPNTGEVWFEMSNFCYIRVKDKELFEKYTYLQSIVGGFLSMKNKRITMDILYDTTTWIRKLGNSNNYEKGKDMLTFFNRLLDRTSIKVLDITPYHKRDVYSLIRWMMANYNYLRLKDNMNLYNKRLRCNEYVAALLTMEFSKRLNRVLSMGQKATMENYREIFKFSGDILLQKLHISGVMRFDDNINDMTFFSKFKVTSKGPHSQGNRDSNRISLKSRGIHPSFITNYDILVCGNSDPGTSMLLSPWSEIKGFNFDPKPETDHFFYEFKKDMEEKNWEKNEPDKFDYVRIESNSKERYFDVLNKLAEISADTTVYYTPTDDTNFIIQPEEDIDAPKED